MDELQTGVIGLVKSALTGERADISANFNWNNALKIAARHQIIPMLYYGAQYSELTLPQEIIESLELATFKNISVSQNQLYALEGIYRAFDENGIDYMPLKGSVLKYIYPKPEMRPMGDADILIRKEQYEKIRPIMASLGFTEILESDHELIWDKKGVLHTELHKRLIPSYNKDYYEYYGDGWRLAELKSNYRYDMRDEDNYIYLFTHYAKHYRDGGIGIRHMTDLYVFAAAHSELDYGYISEELKKLQLFEFYKNTRHTLDVWFCGVKPDNMSDFITVKIFGSGSYGTYDAHILSAAVKASGSQDNEAKVVKSVWIKRLFPPLKSMVSRYKCLEKHPALLPVMWVVRFLQIPFRRGCVTRNIEIAKMTTADKVIAYKDELEAVGLKFNFKE